MPRKRALVEKPPADVHALLAQLGANLRYARVRRGLTVAQAAAKIGVGVRAVREAERGSPGSGIGTSVALLVLFGLADGFGGLAEPTKDLEGLRLSGPEPRLRARRRAAAQQVAPPVKTSTPLRQTGEPTGLAANVLAVLKPEERAALLLLQKNDTARASELAKALGVRGNRVPGLMRELRRKLHGLGVPPPFTDEVLSGGEVLFRSTGRKK